MSRWHQWRGQGTSRRAFLGGAAAMVTLPWLPSLLRGAQAEATAPTRLVFWFVPNGIRMSDFTPTTEGYDWALPRILAPLAPVRDEVTVFSGLTALGGIDDRAGDHARGTSTFLTAVTPSFEGVQLGVSVDQVAAQANGSETVFPSLQLGTESSTSAGICDSGYACAYSNNISWAGPTTPLPKQTDPQLLFDRLFAGFDAGLSDAQRARRLAYRSSVLDRLTGEATALSSRVSASDRHRLDEYLTGVRELERRLASGDLRACEAPGRPGDSVDLTGQIDALSDLTAVALQCDLTRYVTFMLGNGGSNRNYSFLGAPGAHHQLSHHQDLPENLEALSRINTWEIERFSAMLQKLAAIPEGDGTVLDHTLAVLGSDISDGNRHNHDDMPVLLAGRGSGAHDAGRHVRVDGQPVANLYLGMLAAAGVDASTFGADGTEPLAALVG
jgi:hypothetical protein